MKARQLCLASLSFSHHVIQADNWTRINDAITWEPEVPADGTFDLKLYYAWPKVDVGSTIELRFDDSRLTGRITEAHDPPKLSAEHDRFKREESYVKNFRPLHSSTVEAHRVRDLQPTSYQTAGASK